MELESVSRVGLTERPQAVFNHSSSRNHRQWKNDAFPDSEARSEMEKPEEEEVEFSALDPQVGAILSEVTPAAYGIVALRISELLAE